MHPGIKLRHLRLFLAVADSASLTSASRDLGISQPAASKSLAELAEMLGHALFQKQGRRLVLTEAGALLRRHASEALAALEAGIGALSDETTPARISIGLLPTVSSRFFPAIAADIIATRPTYTLSIETGSHPVLLRKLRDHQIDLMIGRPPDPAEMAGLDFEFLYEEPVVAVVRGDHPLAGQPIAEVLARVPVILPTRDAVIRRALDTYLAALGLPHLRPAVETHTLAFGRGLVLASDAVWFISQGVVEAELEQGQMRQIPLGASYLSGAVGLTRVMRQAPSAPLLALMRLARDAAARRGMKPEAS